MRTRPYTAIGIRRLTCFRATCNNRAATQWQICSDKRQYRPVCLECDIDLNRMVLEWAGFDNVEERIAQYRKELEDRYGF